MSDLVERLRDGGAMALNPSLVLEAADEIERLRAENVSLQMEQRMRKLAEEGNAKLRAELVDLKTSREAYNQECRDIATEGIAHWKKIAEEREAELAAIKGQEPPDFVALLKEAEQVVKSKSVWKRFIDGTPLDNDIPVWMATFAQEHRAATVADKDAARKVVDCWCEACDVAANRWRTHMSICPDCGDKRCPKAANHDNACAAMAKGE